MHDLFNAGARGHSRAWHACRNIWGAERGERIWVEVTEPMLRSYAFWRTGSIQTQGFGVFVSAKK